jgi:polyphosphate glucokinase
MSTGIAIGVDVGGSAIKAGAVDTATGRLVGSRRTVATPQPSTPATVVDVIAGLVARIGREAGAPAAGVGVGVPSVVIGGVTKSAANIDGAWIGFDAGGALGAAVGRPVLVLNDADAAGLAEMRFGAGEGRGGTVLVLTLGTGLGSALFTDGKLVPNTELGHMEIRGDDAEHRSAAVARVRDKLSWEAWTADLDEHLHAIDRLFWPDLIILGGGVSQDADRFLPYLTVRPPVVPAELRNDAGIVGAAMAAAEAAER